MEISIIATDSFVSISRSLIVSIWRAVSRGRVGGLFAYRINQTVWRGRVAGVALSTSNCVISLSQDFGYLPVNLAEPEMPIFPFREILWSKQIQGARNRGNSRCFCFPTVP